MEIFWDHYLLGFMFYNLFLSFYLYFVSSLVVHSLLFLTLGPIRVLYNGIEFE